MHQDKGVGRSCHPGDGSCARPKGMGTGPGVVAGDGRAGEVLEVDLVVLRQGTHAWRLGAARYMTLPKCDFD